MLAILGAMREELEPVVAELRNAESYEAGRRSYFTGTLWGHRVVLAFSRWGKVAAATTTTHLITAHRPTRVLFTGVAGAVQLGLQVGDVVVGANLIQHDLDARPLFARYEVPLLERTGIPADAALSQALLDAARTFLAEDFESAIPTELKASFAARPPRAILGDIASGDQFFASNAAIAELRRRLPAVACVEMEGAAVAQVCFEHEVPFGIIRTISDTGGDGAHVAFADFLRGVAGRYAHGILERVLASGALASNPRRTPDPR